LNFSWLPSWVDRPAADLRLDHREFVVEVDLSDPDALEHLGTQLLGVLQEDLVELGAVDVEGVVAVDAVLRPLVEQDLRCPEVVGQPAEAEVVDLPVLRRGPGGTVLLGESGRLDLLHGADLDQHRGRGRHQ